MAAAAARRHRRVHRPGLRNAEAANQHFADGRAGDSAQKSAATMNRALPAARSTARSPAHDTSPAERQPHAGAPADSDVATSAQLHRSTRQLAQRRQLHSAFGPGQVRQLNSPDLEDAAWGRAANDRAAPLRVSAQAAAHGAAQRMADASPQVAQLQSLQLAADATAQRRLGALGVIQRHLFVDTPDDFRQLDDLGMWWVMACEWHNQKTVRKDQVSKEPRDYITSLSDVSKAEGKIDKGEPIRMVAHGDDRAHGETMKVGGSSVKAADKKQEIKTVYEKGGGREMEKDNTFSALYCFGAQDKGIMKQGSFGAGPLVMPRGDISTFDLASGVNAQKWNKEGKFITQAGLWRKDSAAFDALPALKAYKISQAHDGALLATALEEAFVQIDVEYQAFVKALTATGTAPNPWGV